MTKYNVTLLNVNEDGEFLAEVNGKEMIIDEVVVSGLILDNQNVQYDTENEELVDFLKTFMNDVKYVTVNTFADDTNEHDVYTHNASMEAGTIVVNVGGTFVKSYKNEKSAIKFANTLSNDVRVS